MEFNILNQSVQSVYYYYYYYYCYFGAVSVEHSFPVSARFSLLIQVTLPYSCSVTVLSFSH